MLLLLLLLACGGACFFLCSVFFVCFLNRKNKSENKKTKKGMIRKRNADRWVGPKGSRRRRRIPHGDGISVRAANSKLQPAAELFPQPPL